MTVLIFRPEQKCATSVARFSQADISAVGVGLISTQPSEPALANLAGSLAALAPGDSIIVTSTVASQLLAQRDISLPSDVHIFAVGSSTATGLRDMGYQVIVPPVPTTEGLLSLTPLSKVDGHKVVIIKGEGGRQDLARHLNQRGASVYLADIYHRIKIAPPKATQEWQAKQIRCIIATSGELIDTAFEQFDPKWLQSLPWIVVSPRTEQIAAKHGINTIFVSDDASDQALIRRAKEYLEH
ncbi:uroporphyrinogen-III synthase [Paraglaciecola agarilytica]|uniref:uroporphyrinogen-III synthase n=1 Tax=Paraglaciecola chathamensis TaxID=368405 RepID=UPI001C09CA2E|nr:MULTISPECIES: uroporphyrinogen-III synthase [Paraglaciecola]MBU3019047.1 uroporphyrinogen-III synthase [Paraglaciecola agarilytica]MDO6560610.1 uroporphyrinogen-III synthase [Paraglaciecola chathamensis]